VRSDQLVQPGQHGVDVHPATLPSQQAPAATIGQTSVLRLKLVIEVV
jgi:hypothetical protein